MTIQMDPDNGEIFSRVLVVEPASDFPRHPDFIGALSQYGSTSRSLIPRLEDLAARNRALQLAVRDHLASEGIEQLDIPERFAE